MNHKRKKMDQGRQVIQHRRGRDDGEGQTQVSICAAGQKAISLDYSKKSNFSGKDDTRKKMKTGDLSFVQSLEIDIHENDNRNKPVINFKNNEDLEKKGNVVIFILEGSAVDKFSIVIISHLKIDSPKFVY